MLKNQKKKHNLYKSLSVQKLPNEFFTLFYELTDTNDSVV